MTVRGTICILLDSVLLIVALGTGIRELLVAALGLGAFWVFALVSLLLAVCTLRCSGSLDKKEATRGEEVRYTFTLRGFLLLPVAGQLSILPPGVDSRFDGNREHHAFSLLPSFRVQRAYHFALPCLHRGYWQTGLETLRLRDLFGLFSMPLVRDSRRFSILIPLTVYPRIHTLVGAAEEAATTGGFAAAQIQNATSGELLGETRLYQPGDTLNRIHWKQTARMQQVYIRQFEVQENPQVLVLLDTACRSSYRETTADVAVETALSLVQHCMTHQKTVRLMLVRGRTGATNIDRWLRNHRDLQQVLKLMPNVAYYEEAETLNLWQLRDVSFTGVGTVRVVTDNPSKELLEALAELQNQGHTVSCIVPQVDAQPTPVVADALNGTGLHPVILRTTADIAGKVGANL